MLKIKNCPFCGNEADIKSEYDSNENKPDGYLHFVSCGFCDSSGEKFYNVEINKIHLSKEQYKKQKMDIEEAKNSAIKAWNKRVALNKE